MLRIAMFGMGHAAVAFLEMLTLKQRENIYNTPVEITTIATGSRGLWQFPAKGISAEALLEHINSGQALDTLKGAICFSGTSVALAEVGHYDILIELSPLNIQNGQPAISHIEAALKQGRAVVTANKGPIAFDYKRLNELAIAFKAPFFFETTVMDGTPVFNLVRDTLPHCRVLAIEGILNSTTNFILDEMAKGHHIETILEEGRNRGFVEADPSMDIEGHDAAAKITALANVLMQANAVPSDVKRHGIAQISHGDLEVAKKTGSVIKLICRAKRREDHTIELTVAPELIPIGSLMASITSTSSVITLTTDLMGQLTIVEHHPEIQQTAFGIYQDFLKCSQ